MAGGQTLRYLICGMTGGGKSTNGRKLIRELKGEGKYRQLVVVNRKREFEDLCEKHYSVDEQGDPAQALADHPSLFFHVTGYDPRPFLNNLGQALMQHNSRDVLLVVDEAYEFFPRGRVPRGLFRVITGGREHGHHCLFMTQMLKSASGGIDIGVLDQLSHLAVLKMQGEGNVERVKHYFPELGERCQYLKRPNDPEGAPPEIAIKDLLSHTATVRLRSAHDPFVLVDKDLSQPSEAAAF